jgi:hexosaminidase
MPPRLPAIFMACKPSLSSSSPPAMPTEKPSGSPAATLSIRPRFAWRGFMLDESRHFTGPEGVKRLIDAMARFKLNRLHWHLTDSPAWRIEIKKYPELTRIGGRGSETDRSPDAPANYYTQDKSAKSSPTPSNAPSRSSRKSTCPAMPMPRSLPIRNTMAAAYSQKGDPRKWPRFTFNPARKETLAFLDDILTEVAALFPDAGVIHFGGDEVHFGWHKWPELPEVQDLMKRRTSRTSPASKPGSTAAWPDHQPTRLQNRRLGRNRGARPATDKTMIWWWRHDKPEVLKQALADGYPVILCPRRPCYFDFVQHDSHKVGRRWGGFNPLNDVYQFPAALELSAADEAKVLGIQACLWTEATITQARRDFMTWPR